jgi:hypothetical protein
LNKSFIDKLNNHTQYELDSYRLPHPILGKISLGELAIFTSFHTSHHFELLKSKLGHEYPYNESKKVTIINNNYWVVYANAEFM